jgi:hypothetical protein
MIPYLEYHKVTWHQVIYPFVNKVCATDTHLSAPGFLTHLFLSLSVSCLSQEEISRRSATTRVSSYGCFYPPIRYRLTECLRRNRSSLRLKHSLSSNGVDSQTVLVENL